MRSFVQSTPPARVARPADLETVATIIALAFAEDPVWGRAFAGDRGSDDRQDIWRCYLEAAMRFPWTWLSAGDEAASVWIPPGEEELAAAHEQTFVEILQERLGGGADAVLELLDRFGVAHPRGEPHCYLSLLGTHPDRRGAGHGRRLLADNLERIDYERMPAYLESTNPANNGRYGRAGFEAIGSFEGYVPGSVITTMWRPARS
jgi:ribosomal protein S18 acetylase RimI-like enzyme